MFFIIRSGRQNHEREGGHNAADIAGEPARSSSRRGGTVARRRTAYHEHCCRIRSFELTGEDTLQFTALIAVIFDDPEAEGGVRGRRMAPGIEEGDVGGLGAFLFWKVHK